MKVSIVTVSFNQAEFLERTLRSVLDQRDVELEYIVVDPGSTDGSRDIIERYRGRIDHVLFEPDEGAADGLNHGFALASGEVCGYINADDTLLPGALSEVVRCFEQWPEIDVVYGHGYCIDAADRPLRKCFSDRFSLRRAAYGAATVIQPSTFFRRRAFDATQGFNKLNRCSWDGELFIDMAMSGARVRRVERFLSCYRIHGESITGSGRLAQAQHEQSRRNFEKITQRRWASADRWWALGFRAFKHLSNPRATYERLRYGPVLGSAARD